MTETERELEAFVEGVLQRTNEISEQLVLLGEQLQKGFENGLKCLIEATQQIDNSQAYEVGFKKSAKHRKLPPKSTIHRYEREPKTIKRTARSDC